MKKENKVAKLMVKIANNFAKYDSIKSFPILTYEVPKPEQYKMSKMLLWWFIDLNNIVSSGEELLSIIQISSSLWHR